MFLQKLLQLINELKTAFQQQNNRQNTSTSLDNFQQILDEITFEAQSQEVNISTRLEDLNSQILSQSIEHKNLLEEMQIKYDLQKIDLERQILQQMNNNQNRRDQEGKDVVQVQRQIFEQMRQQVIQALSQNDLGIVKQQLQKIDKQMSKINVQQNYDQQAQNETEINNNIQYSRFDSQNTNTKINKKQKQMLRIRPEIPQLQLQSLGQNNNQESQENPQLNQNIMSGNTLTLTDYSQANININQSSYQDNNRYQNSNHHSIQPNNLKKKFSKQFSRESQRAASLSASVNKAVMYSENSIPQLFSSIEQSKRYPNGFNQNYGDGNETQQSLFRNSKRRSYRNNQQNLKGNKSHSPATAYLVKNYREESNQHLIQQQQQLNMQKQASLSLTQKEQILCEIHQRNQQKEEANHNYQHIRPEEVLRNFGSSIEQSKVSLFSSKVKFPDESLMLSPINQNTTNLNVNNQNPKEFVNEVQKIAKEIKNLPSEQILFTNNEQTLDLNQIHNQSVIKKQQNHSHLDDGDEYDSLLEELEKLSARHIDNNFQQNHGHQNHRRVMNIQDKGDTIQDNFHDFIDAPFKNIISSIESVQQVQESRSAMGRSKITQFRSIDQQKQLGTQQTQNKSLLKFRQNTISKLDNYDKEVQQIMMNNQSGSIENSFWDLRDQQRLKKQSKSKNEHHKNPIDAQSIIMNANNQNQAQIDLQMMQSPFIYNSRSQAQAYAHNVNQQNQVQQQYNSQTEMQKKSQTRQKFSINKNQIKFFNLNNLVNQLRQDQNESPLVSIGQTQQHQQTQQQQQPGNNFIEVSNSVIIVQGSNNTNNQQLAHKTNEMTRTQKIKEGSKRASPQGLIDRPFTEMRKLKSNKNSFIKANKQQLTANSGQKMTRAISQVNNTNRRVNSLSSNQNQYDQYLNSAYQMNNYHPHNKSVGEEQIQFANINNSLTNNNDPTQRNFLGNSQIKRRLQNISAIDQSYLNQNQSFAGFMSGLSPNRAKVNIQSKRASTSMNNTQNAYNTNPAIFNGLVQQSNLSGGAQVLGNMLMPQNYIPNLDAQSPYIFNTNNNSNQTTNEVRFQQMQQMSQQQQTMFKHKQLKMVSKRINMSGGNSVGPQTNSSHQSGVNIPIPANEYNNMNLNNLNDFGLGNMNHNQSRFSNSNDGSSGNHSPSNTSNLKKSEQAKLLNSSINNERQPQNVRVIKKNIIKKLANNQIIIGAAPLNNNNNDPDGQSFINMPHQQKQQLQKEIMKDIIRSNNNSLGGGNNNIRVNTSNDSGISNKFKIRL